MFRHQLPLTLKRQLPLTITTTHTQAPTATHTQVPTAIRTLQKAEQRLDNMRSEEAIKEDMKNIRSEMIPHNKAQTAYVLTMSKRPRARTYTCGVERGRMLVFELE